VILKSYVLGRWVEGAAPHTDVVDATTRAVVAQASARGLDLGAALAHARTVGGPALRAMTFAQRGALLDRMAQAIHAVRDDLIDVSRHGGTTRGDAKFDIDGAAGTLAFYAGLGRKLGDRTFLLDGEAERILRSARFAGQHVLVPRHGVAIHVNAFNFPAWGMAEKLAVALLAGMPALAKPATSTAPLAVRVAELWVEKAELPAGVFSLLVGGVGDLLDHVGPQDAIAFTGGGETARAVRGHPAVIANNVPVNIEADSLNAAILGPDVEVGSDTFQMFAADAARDLMQKAGQKCTAIRRILVPLAVADAVVEALVDRLSGIAVGDPADKATGLGPVSTPAQHAAAKAGISALREGGATVAWQGNAPETGCFVAPTLLRSDRGADAAAVHDHEVFGPVATVLPWNGSASEAVAIVARGGGGLVCSVYSDDPVWAGEVVLGLAPWHGRIHWGSRKVHDQSPGPGTVLPNLVHGGPGKAGGGEELGGERGLRFYLQRCAIQGDRGLLERVLGTPAA
jgi:oxepin-CoA hydrolase/3-oxo-5,6-dehydrosuberyl-CoA semialdehyde dehydrogenase